MGGILNRIVGAAPCGRPINGQRFGPELTAEGPHLAILPDPYGMAFRASAMPG